MVESQIKVRNLPNKPIVIIINQGYQTMKRPLLLISTILLLLNGLTAQNKETNISGKLVDETQQPLAFANVTLFDAVDSNMIKAGYSLDDGSYLFTHLKSGEYYLIMSFIGYQSETHNSISVVENTGVIVPTIEMIPQITTLGEIVVASTKPVIEVKPDKTVFNVEGSINATGENGLELLRKAPGVVVDHNERLMLVGKSGVSVYIDGRQSNLQGEDLANFLKSLQSSQIEAIEIITQPSSRFEAAGNAGIINIRLIKDKSQGTNGTIGIGHNQAEHGRSNINGNFNARKDKINFYGNGNFSTGAMENFSVFKRTTPGQYVDQNKTELSDWNNYTLRTGIDIASGAYTTFGILFDGYKVNGSGESTINTDLYPEEGASISSNLIGKNFTDKLDDRYNLNGNYRYDNRNGTILNLDLDYGTYQSSRTNYQPNYYYDPISGELTDENIYYSTSDTEIDIKTLKTDFEKPFAGGTLGAGFKLATVNTDNAYIFYDAIDATLILDPNRTNNFDYTENIYAAYLNYSKKWEKISLQLGARIEQTDSEGILTSQSPENGETVDQNYLDVFPSGGISYQLNSKNAMSLNFSRRIDRPNYQALNPFEFVLDELTYRKGNPFLRPQYSNSFQLNHTYNSMLSTTFSFSLTKDLMAEITDTASNGAVFLTTANIANQEVYALTVSYPFAINKYWNVFINSGVTHKHNTSDFGDGKNIDLSVTTFNIYGQNTYRLGQGITLELSGWYNSPGIWGGNFATGDIWAIDAGIKKSFWNNRATLKVSVPDIFNTQQWSGTNIFGELQLKANGGWESRQLKMNFSYKLGKKEIKGSRSRTTGLEDETSRIQE